MPRRDRRERRIISIRRYLSPCGWLVLGSLGDRLCLCDWAEARHRDRVDERLRRAFRADYEESASGITGEAGRQLDEYFAGKRTVFNTPLVFTGTDFQRRVWQCLMEIPYGKTVSYGEMARRLGCPASARAVANANGENALSIFVPCHRVIGYNRSLTGYSGGLDAKRTLLELEREADIKTVGRAVLQHTLLPT